MKKKFLALVMTLSMVLSLVPMTALAAGDGEPAGQSTTTAENQAAGEGAGNQDSSSTTGGNKNTTGGEDSTNTPDTNTNNGNKGSESENAGGTALLRLARVPLKVATPERAAAPKAVEQRHLQNLLTKLQKTSIPMLSMKLWTQPLRKPGMVRQLRCLQTVRQQAWS